MNKLPVIDKYNVKRLIIEGLESKIAELGKLNVPILIHTDYPSSSSNAINDTGDTVPYRRIVVKRVSTVVNRYAIGDVYASENNLSERELDGDILPTLVDVVGEGWYEDHTIELSVWCRDSNDRDNLLELLRMFMLELNHRNLENGAPYFYNNKIYSVKFNRAYEAQDTKIIGDNVHYVGVLEYSLSAPVYGTTIEEYEKLKISIIGELNPEPGGTTIVIGDKPRFPPIGGGGGIDDTYVQPVVHYGPQAPDASNEVLYVGGPLKTDGGALLEEIFKELEDDE